ncbi:hypothetical protein FRB94_005723 [Tulasnella sp. JGI-2019a]|nr:hypothetical protein FRB94_005723 [Tulasnella sp. JGI-2019a]KAG9000920.1 hypothetical protein FRB93_012525 [Tulasnella sp. JGI-2019a]
MKVQFIMGVENEFKEDLAKFGGEDIGVGADVCKARRYENGAEEHKKEEEAASH